VQRELKQNALVVQQLARFTVGPNARGRNALVVQLWEIVQNTLFAWSPRVMYGWRVFLLRLFGAKVGKRVLVRPSAKIAYPWKVEIGDYAWIGDNAALYSLAPITIGSNAVVSQNSYLSAASHDYREISFPYVLKPILIGEQAWIAADVFVAPGITIGRGAVVGARSTVWHDVPELAIAIGNPAKVVGRRETRV
jgi:putative colanic acid biosynthesis acetyltransferase WcaF